MDVADHAKQRAQRPTPDRRDAVLGELVDRARLAQRGEVAPQAPLARALPARGPVPGDRRRELEFTRERSQVRNPPRPSAEPPMNTGFRTFRGGCGPRSTCP